MRNLRNIALPVVALLAGLVLAPGATLAQASVVALFSEGQPVTVNVGFNAEVPLADPSNAKLAATQRAGREYIYRLAQNECALLLATIAMTCQMTSLHVSTDIRQQNYYAIAPLLYISSNADFTIILKDEEAAILKDEDAAGAE